MQKTIFRLNSIDKKPHLRYNICMKKIFIITIIFLAAAITLVGCEPYGTEGLVYVKEYDEEFSRYYVVVSGGGKTDYTAVTIPQSRVGAYVEVIDSHAFMNCRDLTQVKIPQFVTIIAAQAFKNCVSLKQIALPPRLAIISSEAFYGCSSLEGITIPDSVISINSWAFQQCTGLKTVFLPADMQRINDRMFSGCAALDYIPLPAALKMIGAGAFENCINLSDVKLPMELKSIDYMAFSGCTSIEKIELPSSLVRTNKDKTDEMLKDVFIGVDESAFEGCTSLTEVVVNEDIEIADGAFKGCPIKKLTLLGSGVTNFAAFDFDVDNLDGLVINVSPAALEEYRAHPEWGVLTEYISVI